jgi:organic radical activating enzyme
MSSIKNVYFQNSDNDFYNEIYPFFINLKNSINQKLNEEDQIHFNEIQDYITKNNSLPFKFNSQELLYFKKHPQSSWTDYFLFRYKFRKFPKEKIVSNFPIYVLIEPVSTCNIRCIMCFQIDKSFTRKPFMGTMSMDFFKKIIDDCYANGTKAITLASRGEPTLHPKLPEMLDYVSNKFLEVKLNTNATRLNEKLIRKILETNVNELVYSVDESDEKKYEKIRVGGKFKEVVNNIKNFKKIRDSEFPKSKTTTRISGVLVNEDQDAKVITDFWTQYVDHVVFVKEQNRWDTYNNPPDGVLSPCTYLWERMYVWFDGVTNPCDVDYKSQLTMGKLDYKKNNIRKIWTSEFFQTLRKKHLDNKRQTIKPCDRCGLTF